MNIQVSDPLQLLPFQSGMVGDNLTDSAGKGNTSLDVRQRAIEIGEPISIIFCRRVTVGSSDVGGVFVAPGCSSGRFENDSTTNELTVNLQLILSQGQLGDIKENQLYQRACRVGTWKRAYGQRASSWVPGYHITTVANKEPWICPSYCGTDGKFTDLTALSYTNTHADNDKTWDRQVYAFIQDGLKVTRILDSQLGSSNNFIDLAIYLIKQSQRLPDDMIDTTSMTAAANFLNTNNFLCNGVFSGSENLEDWLTNTGNQFLLRLSEKDGKKCFKPRVSVNANHTINSTNAITPVYGFSEEHILEDSFEIEYIPITERQDACALVLWRQQPDNDIGIIRTSEVKETGVNNPVIIQYDLSKWCCSESHAVKYGAYQIARRKYITHTVRVSVRPSTFNSSLALGDIVRLKLRRETNAGTVDYHDFLYEVERIEKATSGIIKLDLIHFPVDSSKRSIIARAVAAATAVGTVLPTGRNDLTCHSNTGTGNIADDGISYPYTGFPVISGTEYLSPTFDEDMPYEEDLGNADDPFEADYATGLTDDGSGNLKVGDTLTATGPGCVGGRVCYYRRPKTGPAVGEFVPDDIKEDIQCFASDVGSGSYELTSADIDHIVGAEWSCPDPASPDGYGPAEPIGETGNAIEPDVTSFDYVRWKGTKIKSGSTDDETTTYTSDWMEFENYVGLNGSQHCAVVGIYNMDESSTGSTGRLYYQDGAIDPWRSMVKERHVGTTGGGGQRRIGGLGVDTTQGPLCGYATEPKLSTGAPSSQGTEWLITGSWEFSNDTGDNKTVAETWGGRNPHAETDRWKIDSYQSAVDFGISDD